MFGDVRSLCVDQDGRLVVCDEQNGVRVIDLRTKLVSALAETGTGGNDPPSAPRKVVFDAAGTLTYVCHLPGHEAYGMTGVLVAR